MVTMSSLLSPLMSPQPRPNSPARYHLLNKWIEIRCERGSHKGLPVLTHELASSSITSRTSSPGEAGVSCLSSCCTRQHRSRQYRNISAPFQPHEGNISAPRESNPRARARGNRNQKASARSCDRARHGPEHASRPSGTGCHADARAKTSGGTRSHRRRQCLIRALGHHGLEPFDFHLALLVITIDGASSVPASDCRRN